MPQTRWRSHKASQDSLTPFPVSAYGNQFYSLRICRDFWRLLPHLPWSFTAHKCLSLSSQPMPSDHFHPSLRFASSVVLPERSTSNV